MYNYYTRSVVREVAMYADIVMSELLVSDEAGFMNFIRMNNATFDIPFQDQWSWGTQNTKLRLVIPSQEKL